MPPILIRFLSTLQEHCPFKLSCFVNTKFIASLFTTIHIIFFRRHFSYMQSNIAIQKFQRLTQLSPYNQKDLLATHQSIKPFTITYYLKKSLLEDIFTHTNSRCNLEILKINTTLSLQSQGFACNSLEHKALCNCKTLPM